MSRVIESEPGVVLAKLSTSEFGDIPVPVKDYDSITWATVLTVHKEDQDEKGYLLGREIYYRRFKDDARIAFDKTFVLIEIKDILGSSYNEEKHADSTSRN